MRSQLVSKMTYTFDLKKLAKDVLAKRVKEDLSFRKIEKETKIPGQLLFSIEKAESVPSCKSFAMVIGWLGAKPQDYFILKTK